MVRLLVVPTLGLLATAGCEAATTGQAPATSASAFVARASAAPEGPPDSAAPVLPEVRSSSPPAIEARASGSGSRPPAVPPTASSLATTVARIVDAGPPPIVDAGSLDAGATIAAPTLALARQVDAIYLANKTFRARFDQRYLQKVTGIEKTSAGIVFVERPDKVSFRYDPPSRNRIVADGKTLRVYMAEDAQMYEAPIDKSQYPGALGFMLGTGIASSFTFSPWQPPAPDGGAPYAGTILRAKPLTPSPGYETVMFWIGSAPLAARDPGTIERVLVVDALGNRNRFDFHGASVPASIPAAEFTFTPPPGTTITR